MSNGVSTLGLTDVTIDFWWLCGFEDPVWAGFGGGNIWYSTDGGGTWNPTFINPAWNSIKFIILDTSFSYKCSLG